jgi:hypothetical protein
MLSYSNPTILGNPVYDSLTRKTNFTFSDSAASHSTIAFVYIYVMSFALTWACVAWVYPPEIFSMNMRGRATSMTSATNWFVVCLTCKISLVQVDADVNCRISGLPFTSPLPWIRFHGNCTCAFLLYAWWWVSRYTCSLLFLTLIKATGIRWQNSWRDGFSFCQRSQPLGVHG